MQAISCEQALDRGPHRGGCHGSMGWNLRVPEDVADELRQYQSASGNQRQQQEPTCTRLRSCRCLKLVENISQLSEACICGLNRKIVNNFHSTEAHKTHRASGIESGIETEQVTSRAANRTVCSHESSPPKHANEITGDRAVSAVEPGPGGTSMPGKIPS